MADGRRRAAAPRGRLDRAGRPPRSLHGLRRCARATRSARASRARAGCRACRCGGPRSRGDATLVRLPEAVADGIRSTAALPLRAAGVPGRRRGARLAHAARARARPGAPARGASAATSPSSCSAARPRAAPPSRPRTSRRSPRSRTSSRARPTCTRRAHDADARRARRHRGLVGRAVGADGAGDGARGHRRHRRRAARHDRLAGRALRAEHGVPARRAGLPRRTCPPTRRDRVPLARADRRRSPAPGCR